METLLLKDRAAEHRGGVSRRFFFISFMWPENYFFLKKQHREKPAPQVPFFFFVWWASASGGNKQWRFMFVVAEDTIRPLVSRDNLWFVDQLMTYFALWSIKLAWPFQCGTTRRRRCLDLQRSENIYPASAVLDRLSLLLDDLLKTSSILGVCGQCNKSMSRTVV